MSDLVTLANLMTLLMLVMLQVVLGFDNLLYISIESKRVAAPQQSKVRKWGIGLAVVLRIVLLVAVVQAIAYFQNPFFEMHLAPAVDGEFNVHSFIVFLGGVFIIYTAMKEVYHMLAVHDIGHQDDRPPRSVGASVFWIVMMNLVFSFDSILSAIALTDNVIVMATAIVIGGALMIALSNHVAEFLQKNRMYEVLGLFILLIVGIMLVSEGGHLAHLKLFGYAVEPMAKSTFYFVIAVLVIVDLVQGRYQKKLLAQQGREAHAS